MHSKCVDCDKVCTASLVQVLYGGFQFAGLSPLRDRGPWYGPSFVPQPQHLLHMLLWVCPKHQACPLKMKYKHQLSAAVLDQQHRQHGVYVERAKLCRQMLNRPDECCKCRRTTPPPRDSSGLTISTTVTELAPFTETYAGASHEVVSSDGDSPILHAGVMREMSQCNNRHQNTFIPHASRHMHTLSRDTAGGGTASYEGQTKQDSSHCNSKLTVLEMNLVMTPLLPLTSIRSLPVNSRFRSNMTCAPTCRTGRTLIITQAMQLTANESCLRARHLVHGVLVGIAVSITVRGAGFAVGAGACLEGSLLRRHAVSEELMPPQLLLSSVVALIVSLLLCWRDLYSVQTLHHSLCTHIPPDTMRVCGRQGVRTRW